MNISGLNKTTLLDYPERVAATVFTSGCNFRCPFCQNGDLVSCSLEQSLLSEKDFFSFLKLRKGIVTGVCITGGEPTLQKDLPDFIKKIKDLNYAVKLDTNGYNPDVLVSLYEEKLLDYAAMDIKTSIADYNNLANVKNFDIARIKSSVSIIQKSGIPYEFRTTVVKEFHSEEVFHSIGNWLKGSAAYYLQSYQDSEQVLQHGLHSCSKDQLENFLSILQKKIPNTFLRGVD